MAKLKAILAPRDVGGILLLLIGLQLRAVETFELSPTTTQILAGFVGPPPETPRGALRQYVIERTEHRHRVTPPTWLGWSCLSLGGTLLAHRVLTRK